MIIVKNINSGKYCTLLGTLLNANGELRLVVATITGQIFHVDADDYIYVEER